MLYRVLGSTGLNVSAVGVGTWQFGGEWGHSFTQGEVDAILDAAAECGINLIDTAECYGGRLSETLIGDYLSRRDRSRWIVATKFGHRFHSFMNRTDDYSLDGVREQLEGSLRALRAEAIDVYQFHSGSDDAFRSRELWDLLHEFQQEGKVRHLGVSIRGSGSEMQAQEAKSAGAEMLQIQYNRLNRVAEQMYFPVAERDNLGIFARVPLASGLLSGKYRRGASFAPGDYRSTLSAARVANDLAEVERIRATEVPAGVDMAQWAIAWCLRNPVVSAVIPGCKDADQARTNAGAVELLV